MKTKSSCSHPGFNVLGGWVGESPPIIFSITVTRLDWGIPNTNMRNIVFRSLMPSNDFSNPMNHNGKVLSLIVHDMERITF